MLCRVDIVVACFAFASRAHQSRGPHPRSAAGGDEFHFVYHDERGRDCFDHANFSCDQRVERGHLTPACFDELRRDDGADCVGLDRDQYEPPNVPRVLRNEFCARAG